MSYTNCCIGRRILSQQKRVWCLLHKTSEIAVGWFLLPYLSHFKTAECKGSYLRYAWQDAEGSVECESLF